MTSYLSRRRGSRQTTWPEFWGIKKMIEGEPVDELERAQKVASYGSTLLDIQKKKRDLAGPSPTEKYNEEQRSGQVKSALEMYSTLYKTASPASKKRLTEQMTSLWGMMTKSERTETEMIASHTPINPSVQKAMWFEETNPRPTMDAIIRYKMPSSSPYGQPTPEITNLFERNEGNRQLWAEFDIASDEWNTLREMAVSGKSATEANWKSLPKQYQTENPKVTAYRDPLDKRVKYFDWSAADQAEILNAIEKGWATQADMMTSGVIPLSTPREYVDSGRPVTVKQVREVVSGSIKLDYNVVGPQEERVEAPKALTDAIALIDSGKSPESLKVKAPAVIGYYTQLDGITKATGEERQGLQLALQESIATKYPASERYIPFVPSPERQKDTWYRIQQALDWVPGLAIFVPTPTPGKQGNIALVRVDRRVPFLDMNETERLFWWDDINRVAYDYNGVPMKETLGKTPGSQINLNWSK